MIRRSRRPLSSISEFDEEDVNPNSYITNLADCMLVLAVGLMVALITSFGLDLTQAAEPEIDTTGIEVELDQDNDGQIDEQFQQTGTLYYDAENGQYYLVD